MSRMFPPRHTPVHRSVIKENDLQKTPDAYCVGIFYLAEQSPSSICRRCLAAMLNG